jgi:hypothetical protein
VEPILTSGEGLFDIKKGKVLVAIIQGDDCVHDADHPIRHEGPRANAHLFAAAGDLRHDMEARP